MFGSIAAGAASGINEEEWRASRRSPVQQFLSTNEGDATSDPDSISALRNRTPNPDNNNSSFIVQESNVEGGPRTLRVNIDESAVIVPQLDQSWLAEDDEEDDQELETILESYLKELLVATDGMPPWRARMYITQNAGRLVPFKMMDVDLITAAYLSLSPEDQHRYAALNLTAPISVARKILISKLINTFSITVILLSIILLCVETDPVLKPYDVMIIFWLEFFCMTVFLTEIVLQRICIRMSLFQCMRSQFPKFNHRMSKLFQLLYTVSFTDNKVKRISTGVDKAPQFFAFHPSSKEAESPCPSSMGQQTKNHCYRQIQFQYLDTDYVKWNWLLIDLIAVVPFAVQVIVYGIQSIVTGEGFTEFRARMYSWEGNPDILRLLRLFRILRLFKVGQKSDRIRMIWKAVANSTDGIFLLFMIVPLFVVFFSFVLFYAEMNSGYLAKGVWYYSDGRLSKFQSIADCMWCLMQTLTTVGYGDLVPDTPQGKIVMGIVMLLSLFIIAFPLCMITMQYTHHARMYSEQTKAHTEAAHRLRERMAVVDESAAFIPTSPTPSPPLYKMRSVNDGCDIGTAFIFETQEVESLNLMEVNNCEQESSE